MLFHPVIADHVYIGRKVPETVAKDIRCFSTEELLQYHPYNDDFGPHKISDVFRFAQILDYELVSYPDSKILYNVPNDCRRAFANAVFLMGSYLMLRLRMDAESVMRTFRWVDSSLVENFRDAGHSSNHFDISLLDCWNALERALSLEWIGSESQPGIWGGFDVDEYELHDHPLNGGMNVIVPHKIVAFKSPRYLKGKEYVDEGGHRYFSPSYYVDIFKAMNVTAVVRLGAAQYDAMEFEYHGIHVHDLDFEEGTVPCERVLFRFRRIMSIEAGVVAVHCRGGLGRTGTLIARYLMHVYGFHARDAIAWMRLSRPGSVLGSQQQHLVDADAAHAAANRSLSSFPPSAHPHLSDHPRALDDPAPPRPRRPGGRSASFCYPSIADWDDAHAQCGRPHLHSHAPRHDDPPPHPHPHPHAPRADDPAPRHRADKPPMPRGGSFRVAPCAADPAPAPAWSSSSRTLRVPPPDDDADDLGPRPASSHPHRAWRAAAVGGGGGFSSSCAALPSASATPPRRSSVAGCGGVARVRAVLVHD